MKKIGKFQIFSVIQRGPITHVYKAVQPELQRVVLLKQLNPEIAADEELVHRFKQEGLVLAKIKSPHVITIFDFGEENGIPYLVTEFIEGETLADILARNKTIPWDVALYVLQQLTQALVAIHEHNLIHQDIKPENIFISDLGDVKLGDLGFSTSLKESENQIQGTPSYLPPELVSGAAVDFRSDLYSLGLVGYEMLVGENPFFAEEMQTVLNRIVNLRPASSSAANSEIPFPVSEIIEKLIDKNPDNRFQAASELHKRFEQFNQNLETPVNKQIFLDYLADEKNHRPTAIIQAASENPPESVRNKWYRTAVPLALGFVLVIVLFLMGQSKFKSNIFFGAADSVQKNEESKFVENKFDSPQPENKTDTLSTQIKIENTEISDSKVGVETAPKIEDTSETIISPEMKTREILISSDPHAFVFLGDDSLGITPLKISIQPDEKTRDLELRNPAFPVIRKQIPNYAQSAQKIHIDLWQEVGYLQISVVPWGEIWIDGDSIDVSPIPVNRPIVLAPGIHELMVRHPQLAEAREQLYIAVSETLKKNIYLQPKH